MDNALPTRIFVLCHSWTSDEGDPDLEEDHFKELFYSFSEDVCAREIEFYRQLPGFKDHPDGFRVMQTKLHEHYWESGFTTERYGVCCPAEDKNNSNGGAEL